MTKNQGSIATVTKPEEGGIAKYQKENQDTSQQL